MPSHPKEDAIKAHLTAQGGNSPPFVSIERFFDGNQDQGSIGCNLLPHPGLSAFREVLVGLTRRRDVEAVYAQVAEIDPGAGLWPFADTVFVVGTITVSELARLLEPLHPDEVASSDDVRIPPRMREGHGGRVLYAWWD